MNMLLPLVLQSYPNTLLKVTVHVSLLHGISVVKVRLCSKNNLNHLWKNIQQVGSHTLKFMSLDIEVSPLRHLKITS